MNERTQIASLESILCPSTQVELILSLDLLHETIDVRRSTIYEHRPDCLIVSQTDPILDPQLVGEEIEVTYLQPSNAGGMPSRWGYLSRIRNIIDSYPLAGYNKMGQAIMLGYPKESVQPVNIRLFYRYSSARMGGVAIELAAIEDYIDLINLSFGGCLVSVPKPFDSRPGRKLDIVLDLDEEGKVIASAEIRHATDKNDEPATIVGLRFTDISVSDSRRLQRKLNQLIGLERAVKPDKKQTRSLTQIL